MQEWGVEGQADIQVGGVSKNIGSRQAGRQANMQVSKYIGSRQQAGRQAGRQAPCGREGEQARQAC
jgi:hypothetical protein